MRGILVAALIAFGASSAALAARPGFGQLFHDGNVVRTVVPPAAMPQQGRDNLYVIMEGAEGQLAVAAVAPGDREYHGGKWAFHSVTWNTTPYLLRSEAEVRLAADNGDVSISRLPEKDFKCPIQP